jgi:sugar phosphate isomerase/epimerase
LPTRREFLASTAAFAVRPTKHDISLAAWSLNQSFFKNKKWKNLDLPRILREELQINGLEYVNQFFENPTMGYLRQLKKNCDGYGITSVLIMIDDEGDMADADRKERMQAAVAHRKWVDVANFLGCHAVRCNMGGPRENWQADKDVVSRAAESFTDLLNYAKGAGLSVVIENHGRASSDPAVLVALMKAVNRPEFGTLPDFGNVNPGADHEQVLRQLVPYAKGISVKASWAPDGTHPRYSLERMIKICQDAGYRGFWGIESGYGRGQAASPEELWQNELKGVRLTKAVLERTVLKRSA